MDRHQLAEFSFQSGAGLGLLLSLAGTFSFSPGSIVSSRNRMAGLPICGKIGLGNALRSCAFMHFCGSAGQAFYLWFLLILYLLSGLSCNCHLSYFLCRIFRTPQPNKCWTGYKWSGLKDLREKEHSGTFKLSKLFPKNSPEMELSIVLIIPDYQPRQMLHYFGIRWLIVISCPALRLAG
jgi:hypothetical protein